MKRLRTKEDIPLQSKFLKNNVLDEKIFKEDFFLFYWIDIYEDEIDKKGRIYLFGKIYIKSLNEYKTCSIGVDGNMRTLFIYPNNQTDEGITTALNEFMDVRKNNNMLSSKTAPFKAKPVDKQYYFGKEVPHGKNRFIECLYPYSLPKFDAKHTKGSQYGHIFGTSTKATENFLIQKKIMGPCWLKIKTSTVVNNSLSRVNKKTLCYSELIISNPAEIMILTEEEIKSLKIKPSPGVTLTSIAIQTIKDKSIIAISCISRDIGSVDDMSDNDDEDHYKTNIFIKSNSTFDLYEKNINITKEQTEHSLLLKFLEHLKEIDPDVIIGHNIDNDIKTITNRMKNCHIFYNFYLGRLDHDDTRVYNNYTTGRLVCNTLLSTKEIFKSRDYNLSYLAKTVFDNDIKDIDENITIENNHDTITNICLNLYDNSLFSIKLVQKFNILSLTKYLTSLCGNTWRRSLIDSKSERIEYLLMHTFYDRGFILPDKKEYMKDKPYYKGGLVLDPSIGLYDSLIVLLDFKSLYPSVIKENDICFTTINGGNNTSILPDIVSSLIIKRRKVKEELKVNISNKQNLEIQQLAIKLVTRSEER